MNIRRIFLTLAAALCAVSTVSAQNTYKPKGGPGNGKKIVLLAGDEEYRSEEVMPMLAKLLAGRHGFTCTVVWSINPAGWTQREIEAFKKANKDATPPKPADTDPNDGTIDPNEPSNLPGMEALADADACIMLLRFRAPHDGLMKHFDDFLKAGKPIIALRTSTHAFNFPGDTRSPFKKYGWTNKDWEGGGGFGKVVLGETWVSHWGKHKSEATLGVIEESQKGNPLLRGTAGLFGDSDVYEADPPKDATILVRGQVLKGMTPDSGPADYQKAKKDKTEQPVNNPMQPVVWTREYKNEAGTTNKIFCTTMGAATDMKNEAMRRLVVNAVYSFTGLEVPEKADVDLVGNFAATPYGFNGFVKGLKPENYSE
ncbi:hypothetical protein AYO49_02570 [Verrucomicrobiaceae bacterium SCGC AG-212-N21]|nr:hypothetical protein AYO49_02570 [Verrucomicrobiaceae bacterium SCGC AG-212-N21]